MPGNRYRVFPPVGTPFRRAGKRIQARGRPAKRRAFFPRFFRRLILPAAAFMVLFYWAETAAAYNPHDFTVNAGQYTAACGSCHGTHAATGKNLLSTLAEGLENEIYRNCMYCHKAGGQSKLDVYNGAILADDGSVYAASGGGIMRSVIVEGASPQYADVTSKHDVSMADGATIWTPGWDTGAGGNVFLTCTSCHNPHGGDSCYDCHNWDISVSAMRRLLRTTINGVNVTPPVMDVASGTIGGNESVKYYGDANAFCGACHADFNAQQAGAGDTDSGTYTQHKRHRVGMDPGSYPGLNPSAWTAGYLNQPSEVLPLQDNGGAPQVNCLTCHIAHSTGKTNSVTFTRTNGTSSNSSTLLRMNNRGVCQACHSK